VVGAGKPLVTPFVGGPTAIDAPTLQATTAEAPSGAPAATAENQYNTEFPLPTNISGFTDLGDGAINFQTKISVQEAVSFYRESFAKQGYKERTINASITDTTLSLVFDGHASGKAIVVQGVDMGGGVLNINIRFEKI
jgi:hypothetical protein